VNCGRIATPRGSRPLGGRAMGALYEVEDGVIVIDEGGVILAVGPRSRVKVPEGADELDAGGMLVVPGFVDPHTHAVFAGERSFEVEHKVAGKTYLEIQQMGGGIHHTVEATRKASADHLAETGKKRLHEMLRQGTTTVEVKSGYGLDTENEIKMLRAIERIKAAAVQDVVPTLLAAHAVPRELAKVRDVYVQMVLGEMLPEVLREGLAAFVDDFAANESVPAGRIALERARDVTIEFDREHLRQVLWNLLRNAVRHARQEPGGVRIALNAYGDQVELNVSDNGPGVPRAIQGQLFEPFFTTESKGTGLGLYLARELCAANGAALEYVDDMQGAHFRILCREVTTAA